MSTNKNKTHVILIYNNKGGIGKTTLTANIANIMGTVFHKKVLLIDWDPQNSLTSMFNINTNRMGALEFGKEHGIPTMAYLVSYFERWGKLPPIQYISNSKRTPTYTKAERNGMKWIYNDIPFGCDIIPGVGQDTSFIELAFMSQTPDNHVERHYILTDEGKKYNRIMLQLVVKQIEEYFDYDFIFIDCPPSLGVLSLNGIAASRELIIPTFMDMNSAEGINTVLRNVESVKKYIPDFEIKGILCNKYKRVRSNDRIVLEEINNSISDVAGIKVFDTKIVDKQLVVDSNTWDYLASQVKDDYRTSIINFVKEYFDAEKIEYEMDLLAGIVSANKRTEENQKAAERIRAQRHVEDKMDGLSTEELLMVDEYVSKLLQGKKEA
jgi:chromosome partitioning protein